MVSNTKLTFYLPDIRDEPFEVQFIEGQYVNEIFADTLAFFMNKTVATTLGNNYNGVDYSEYSNFKTHIYQVNGIFQIYNQNKDTGDQDKFVLVLECTNRYDINKEQPKMIYEENTY